jgi:uncharacterized membrane protein SpoIIM required for sporulation
MALESIISPFTAVEKPGHMFFTGLIYASLAVFLSNWVFRDSASLIMVFLTVLAAVPIMYSTMKMEENVTVKLKDEVSILKRHAKVIEYLMFLFLGFVVAYTFWFSILPAEIVENLFSTQLQTIQGINSHVSGQVVSNSGNIFFQIFLNNFKVLLFALFFSFFYGAGAIFILTWNASVIAAAAGSFIQKVVASGVHITGAVPLAFLRYAIHGIPEIMAYFVAGLAGGIISVAMINRDLETNKFRRIVLDVIDLCLIAIVILILAALLEVYVTPLFFS